MRCRNCDYPLWNIRTRQCPECGTDFAPSEYVFVPNSVRFCCQHCDQVYYGIDSTGHIEPRQFTCVNCQRDIDMDEMVLRPAVGVDDAATQVDRMPWFDRHRTGTAKAWFHTIGYAMTKPDNLIRSVSRDQPAAGAWLFMFLTNLIFQIVGTGIPMTIALVAVWLIGQNVQGMGGLTALAFQQTWWQLPLAIFLLAGVPVVWMWLTHLLLSSVGAASEPMRRTAHCIYYSSPANALSAIPCGDCTQLAGKIWWMVSAILMVKTAHRCSGGKASFAVITGAVLSWGVAIGGAMVLGFLMMGLSFSSGQMNAMELNMTGPMRAPIVAGGLQNYATEHAGRTPRHALELVVDAGLGVNIFSIVTPESTILIEDKTLEQFALLTPVEQREVVDRLNAAQPDELVAHRFGDIIFTYHGIDVRSADQKLWLFVIWPPPMNTDSGSTGRITICQGDATTIQIKPSQFAEELARQNRWRNAASLPPLPENLLDLAMNQTVPAMENAE